MPIVYKDDGIIKRPNKKMSFDKHMLINFAACARSVKYFAENYYYIISLKKGSHLMELRDYQIRMLDSFENNQLSVVLSGRQSGKTTCAAIYILWFCCFNKDKTFAVLGNKADTAKSILSEIKDAYEKLPEWLKPGVEEYNAYNIKFDNGCSIIGKATSVNALRGETCAGIFLDEFAFVPNAEEFWATNYPTISTGGKCIMVSTPCGTANLYYKIWKDAIDKKNTFNPVKVDWWEVPGRDENWKKETIKNLGIIKFNMEFACLRGETYINIRCKVTNKIYKVKIKDLYEGKDLL